MQGTINAYGHRDLYITHPVVACSPCTFGLTLFYPLHLCSWPCQCTHCYFMTDVERENNRCMRTYVSHSSGTAAFVLNEHPKCGAVSLKRLPKKKKEVDISQPNLMIVTCWGLALNQKAEPDNPHNDPEELFSSPPIDQKFTLHPFTTKELLYFPFSLSIFLSFS